MACKFTITLPERQCSLLDAVVERMESAGPVKVPVDRAALVTNMLAHGLFEAARQLKIDLKPYSQVPEVERMHSTAPHTREFIHALAKAGKTKGEIIKALVANNHQTARGGLWSVATLNRILSRPPPSATKVESPADIIMRLASKGFAAGDICHHLNQNLGVTRADGSPWDLASVDEVIDAMIRPSGEDSESGQ